MLEIAEAGGPRGYDGANMIKGRKRNVMVGTDEWALVSYVHAADVQDSAMAWSR